MRMRQISIEAQSKCHRGCLSPVLAVKKLIITSANVGLGPRGLAVAHVWACGTASQRPQTRVHFPAGSC